MGFGDICHLTPLRRLSRFLFVRPAFCLRLPSDSPRGGHPCRSANTSPHRVCGGLSPLSRSLATTAKEQRLSRRYAPCPAH
ncbi:hypothetical protein, partial [Photorhabdus heterorhabditis]|uniref:hypothetical protein n=1 Tax=Photorhabdus heterorhabditis TaxID=880156 RepID=UPI001BD32674